jgi:type IV pilus assembly PilO-like protein
VSAPPKKPISRRALLALVVVALVAVAALGYLALIAPKRSVAADLDRQTAAVQAKVAEYRAATPTQQAARAAKAATVFKLVKAMPEKTDMSGVILELGEVASGSGIVFDAITPGVATAENGYHALPITLVFRGNYYGLTDFLFRLRNLVAVRDGRLSAHGRLFAVDTVSFVEDDERSFPYVKAELTVTAFVFGAAPVGALGAETQTTTEPTPGETTPATTQPSNDAAPAAAPGS